MNQKPKTTEFSSHLSRSRMSRYLHDQLSEKEIKEFEQHLSHCEQCSEGVITYIHHEEPQHSKAFQKRLKGKLKSVKSGRKAKINISSTQKKVARAAAALLLLFIFSFFGINTVMNKQMAGKEEPKTEIRIKKKHQQQNITPPIEQKTDNAPIKKLSSAW